MESATDPLASSDRRVINFSKKSTGLATITVNFHSNDSASESEGHSPTRPTTRDVDATAQSKGNQSPEHRSAAASDEDVELRKGLLQDMSKMDARYAIMKSRLEQKQVTKQRHSNDSVKKPSVSSSSKMKERVTKQPYIGSMVADIEEKSSLDMKRRKKRERRHDRQQELEGQKRKSAGYSKKARRDQESSDDDDAMLSENRIKQLTEETRRIKMQELQRSMDAAREGDLRNILKGKQKEKEEKQHLQQLIRSSTRPSKSLSSDDEEEVERKLREKTKEEKHKRLFGKLNREDRHRLQKEREELRLKLERKQRQRKHSESTDSHKKQKSDIEREQEERHKTTPTPEHSDEQEDDDDDDQWVEKEEPQPTSSPSKEKDEEENLDEEILDVHRNSEEKSEERDVRFQSPIDKDEQPTNSDLRGLQISAEVMKASVHGGDKCDADKQTDKCSNTIISKESENVALPNDDGIELHDNDELHTELLAASTSNNVDNGGDTEESPTKR